MRCELDRLVLRPAHPPAELDLAALAGLQLERPFHHAAAVTQIARRGRRGCLQHLDLDIFRLADRQLILDRNLDGEFVAVAERMLNDLRISVGSMRQISEQQRGQIIISSIMSVATGLLPAIVAKYRASRPGIEIILREGVHGTVLEDIRSGAADLGATYVDDVPDFVESKRVSREVFDVILPRSHPLTKSASCPSEPARRSCSCRTACPPFPS